MQPSLRDSTNVLDRLQFRATITGIGDVCVERRKPHSDPLVQPASCRVLRATSISIARDRAQYTEKPRPGFPSQEGVNDSMPRTNLGTWSCTARPSPAAKLSETRRTGSRPSFSSQPRTSTTCSPPLWGAALGRRCSDSRRTGASVSERSSSVPVKSDASQPSRIATP